MKPISKELNSRNCITLWLNTIESWKGFERIAFFIESKCGGKVVEKTDGPDSRIWIFEINDSCFSLQHDDLMGNCICSLDCENNWIVEELENCFLDALKKNN